jgi:hypothetical protein
MLTTLSATCGSQQAVLRGRAVTTRQPLARSRLIPRSRGQHLAAVTASAHAKDETVNLSCHGALRSIYSALQVGAGPVACQGAVQLSTPVRVFGQNLSGQHFGVQLPPSDEAALQPLLDACAPAGSGQVLQVLPALALVR